MSEESIKVDKNLYEVLTHEGLESAIQFAQTRLTDEFSKKRLEINLELQEFIVKSAWQEVKSLTQTLRKFSLPPDLVKLFEIDSKKDVKRFAENDLVIKDSDFVKLILNAETFGFHHQRMHKEFIPEDLKTFDPREIAKVDPQTKQFTKEGKKAVTKITQIFKQRKQLSVHWFQFGFEWHCFFFDGGDLLGNHWVGGDHIHYVSHLWGLSSEEVWNGFQERGYSPSKAHIKYIHNMRER